MLENKNGVKLELTDKHKHWTASNAQCCCGQELYVAPPIFHPDHKRGDPVMVCADQGVHAYRFSDLIVGRQPEPEKVNANKLENKPD